MRYIISVTYIVFYALQSTAQPKLSGNRTILVDYSFHDDRFPNKTMEEIKNFRPAMLLTTTPRGYWKGGVISSQYTSLGIQVYSYIVGGYEGTTRRPLTDLKSNVILIDSIAYDDATGVLMDEVSSNPNENSKRYISSIYNECRKKGLKLILSVGVSSFDPWLMDHCDYLISDEYYSGRMVSRSEAPYLNRIIVLSQNLTNAASAAKVMIDACNNGFGYCYACMNYASLPKWLKEYKTFIDNPSSIEVTKLKEDIALNESARIAREKDLARSYYRSLITSVIIAAFVFVVIGILVFRVTLSEKRLKKEKFLPNDSINSSPETLLVLDIGVKIAEILNPLLENTHLYIRRVEKRNALNLAIGMSISVSAMIFLGAQISNQQTSVRIQDFSTSFLPRLAIIAFMQIFAFFFLRLYRNGLDDIRYFQNELTNLTAKILAIKASFFLGNMEQVNDIVKSISQIERNFTLSKNETTVGIEKAKIDSDIDKAFLLIDQVKDTLNLSRKK